MKKIELSKQGKNRGKFFALVDDESFKEVSKYRWNYVIMGYAESRLGSKKNKPIRMHIFLMNPPKGMFVDHINMNGLDNRKENLRLATYQQNNYNRRLNKNNKSGYKGVIWDKSVKKWRAYIRSGKMIYLGVFKTKLEAAKTYNEAAIKLFKEFAKLNKI